MRNLKGDSIRTVLLALLVAAVFAPPLVHAKDYTVGVKAGDWVKYGQVTFNWTGNGTEPSFATEFKKIDWMRIDIINVTGTIATLNLTLHFNDSTQSVQSYGADVQNGSSEGNSLLVGSNLIVGDPLSPAAPGAKINETVVRMYAGANRNVNAVEVKSNLTMRPDMILLGESITYWDQNTGVLVESYINQTYPTYPGAYFTESVKATETNLWSASLLDLIQNNLFYVIAGIAVIVIIVTTAIILRRRKPPPPQQPPPPPTSAPPPSP